MPIATLNRENITKPIVAAKAASTGSYVASRTKVPKAIRKPIKLMRIHCPRDRIGWLSGRDRSRVHEAGDRTTRVAEELESVRERAAIVHDQLLEKRSDKMNRYTLLLTVVASIFLPLGLITGLLGINVGGIPGANTPWAFAAVTALLIGLGGLQLWLYRRMKLI